MGLFSSPVVILIYILCSGKSWSHNSVTIKVLASNKPFIKTFQAVPGLIIPWYRTPQFKTIFVVMLVMKRLFQVFAYMLCSPLQACISRNYFLDFRCKTMGATYLPSLLISVNNAQIGAKKRTKKLYNKWINKHYSKNHVVDHCFRGSDGSEMSHFCLQVQIMDQQNLQQLYRTEWI